MVEALSERMSRPTRRLLGVRRRLPDTTLRSALCTIEPDKPSLAAPRPGAQSTSPKGTRAQGPDARPQPTSPASCRDRSLGAREQGPDSALPDALRDTRRVEAPSGTPPAPEPQPSSGAALARALFHGSRLRRSPWAEDRPQLQPPHYRDPDTRRLASCETCAAIRVTSYELRVTSYELRVTSYELRVTSYELRVTSYELRVTSYGLTFSVAQPLAGMAN